MIVRYFKNWFWAMETVIPLAHVSTVKVTGPTAVKSGEWQVIIEEVRP